MSNDSAFSFVVNTHRIRVICFMLTTVCATYHQIIPGGKKYSLLYCKWKGNSFSSLLNEYPLPLHTWWKCLSESNQQEYGCQTLDWNYHFDSTSNSIEENIILKRMNIKYVSLNIFSLWYDWHINRKWRGGKCCICTTALRWGKFTTENFIFLLVFPNSLCSLHMKLWVIFSVIWEEYDECVKWETY